LFDVTTRWKGLLLPSETMVAVTPMSALLMASRMPCSVWSPASSVMVLLLIAPLSEKPEPWCAPTLPAVKPADAGLLPPTRIWLPSFERSVTPAVAVVVAPVLTSPAACLMPPLTVPVTVSVTSMVLPSAALNCSVPSAALPLTVMLAAASALRVPALVSAVSRLAPVSGALPVFRLASWTPPTDSA
jgi:hypothetical protein